MSSLVAFSPQYLSFDPKDESAASPFDAWSNVAINRQGATANTFPIETWITEDTASLANETEVRIAGSIANLIVQTPDALQQQASGFAASNNAPEFLMRHRAPPVGKPKGNTTLVVAEWEGYVTGIEEKTIEARLTGLRGEGVAGELEEATIPKSEVADADQPLVAIGALFRLCISYEKTPAGERRRYSTLVFRRLPAYRQQDLDAAHERTRARLNGLRVD